MRANCFYIVKVTAIFFLKKHLKVCEPPWNGPVSNSMYPSWGGTLQIFPRFPIDFILRAYLNMLCVLCAAFGFTFGLCYTLTNYWKSIWLMNPDPSSSGKIPCWLAAAPCILIYVCREFCSDLLCGTLGYIWMWITYPEGVLWLRKASSGIREPEEFVNKG